MRDFALDSSGDIVIENSDIALVSGDEQEVQKIRQILGTRLGEWVYDENEGIDFDAFMQKNPDLQRIRETVRNALNEISESYVLQDCSYEINSRLLKLSVSAENQGVQEIYLEVNTN
jgi:hypothetical protein